MRNLPVVAVACALACSACAVRDPSPPFTSPRGPHVTGTVVDEAGRPIAGALVFSAPDCQEHAIRLAPDGSPIDRVHASAVSDEHGRFAVPVSDVEPFSMLFVQEAGRSPVAALFVKPGDDVPVLLDHAASMWGSVLDDQAGLWNDRPLELHGIAPGEYRLEITVARSEKHERRVTIKRGEPTEVDVWIP
jgi:hypothetical protein